MAMREAEVSEARRELMAMRDAEVSEARRELRSLCWWFLQVTIVMGASVVVIWISLTPKPPVFIINNLELHRKNFTLHGSVSRNGTSTSFLIELTIINPNKKMDIFFEEVNVTFSRSGVTLGNKSLPGFFQRYKEKSSRQVVLNSRQSFGTTSGGKAQLKFSLETTVKFRILGLETRHHQVDLEAYVPIGSDGRIDGKKNIKLGQRKK